MADGLTIEVKNAAEIRRKLEQLSDRAASRVMLAAVRAGAAEARKAGKRAAPVRTRGGVRRVGSRSGRLRAPGFLSRRIIYRRRRAPRGTFRYWVGPAREAFYGWILESGRGGNRPIPARRWFQGAWQSSRRAIFDAVVKGYEKAFAREARRGVR